MISKLRRRVSGFVMLASWLMVIADPVSLDATQDHNQTPMELSGYSISEAFEIPDDQPLDLNSPTLKQLLYRIKNTSPGSRRQYGNFSRELTWKDICTKTEDYRLWLFERSARLKKIEKYPFQNYSLDEEIKGVFVCECESEPDIGLTKEIARGHSFLVLARTIPRELPIGSAIDEPIRISGFLYARVSGTHTGDNNEMPVFITDRIAWFPSRESEDVSVAHLSLSRYGADIGLLDFVQENNARPLGNRDAEAFFQILAAVNRMNRNDVEPGPTVDVSDSGSLLGFEELMQNSNTNFGEAARVTGTVRTCSVVAVPHEDIKRRLGISKYYQLMLFPDLDGAKIVVKNKDGTKMDYRRFPVTICCTELPAGMSPTDLERKQFVVDGYFFRFWRYESDKTDQAAGTGQVSPLIIAKCPQLIGSDTSSLNLALLVFAIATLAGIIILIGGYRIADRQRQTPVEKILGTLPDQIDLSGLED